MKSNPDIADYLLKVRSAFPVQERGKPTQLSKREAAYYEEAVERLPYWDMPKMTLRDSRIRSAIVGMKPHAFLSYLPGICQLAVECESNLSDLVSLLSIQKEVVRQSVGASTLADFLEAIRDYSYGEWPRKYETTWREVDGIIEYLRERHAS